MNRYTGTPVSFLNLVFDAAATLLVLRFVFVLFGASTSNVFMEYLLTVTGPMVSPFAGIFPTVTIAGLSVEWPTLVALFVYEVVFTFFMRLLYAIAAPWSDETEKTHTSHHRHA